jgi:outer membrane protein TolC
MALANNLALQRSQADIAGAKRRADNSWNTFIPSLAASGSVGRATSLTDPIPTGQNDWIPGLSLSAGLQFSPAMITGIGQTKQEYAAGRITYAAARQELEFQVRKLYYQIILLQSNVKLTEQNAATAQTRYEQTLSLGRIGQASRLDELSAQVDLQTQASNLRGAETQAANALDSLRQLLMIGPAETITLQGSFMPPMENVPENDESPVQHEPLAIATVRQSLELMETQRKALLNQTYAPVLSLSWNTSPRYSASAVSGDKAWVDNGQFTIALSFNLDNVAPWSPAREKIAALNDSIANQQSVLQETLLNSRNSLERLRRNITQSLENIETLHLTVTLADETYKMYEESYRKGAADLQSLRSAQDSLSLAQNRVLEEQYNLTAAILELEKELNVPFGSLRFTGRKN